MTTTATRTNLYPNPGFEYFDASGLTRFNLCPNPSFEYDVVGNAPAVWVARNSGSGHPDTLTVDTTHKHGRLQALLCASTASSIFGEGPVFVLATTNGITYTMSGWVWNTAGNPNVSCGVIGGTSGNNTAGVTGSFVQ